MILILLKKEGSKLMPIPSKKNKGGLPKLPDNPNNDKKPILPPVDNFDSKHDEQSKPKTGLPDLSAHNELPKEETFVEDNPVDQSSIEEEDERAFAPINEPKEQEPTVSYDNNNSFEQLSEKEVQNEDKADEIEENTASQYTPSEPEPQHDEQPIQHEEIVNNRPPVQQAEAPKQLQSDDPFEEGTDTQYEDPEEYVDTKRKRIIPFGGKKSKKRVSERGFAQFDSRNNLQTSVRVVRSISMAAIVFVIGLGAYNTFFKHIPNQAEITTIAQSVSGNIGFPTQKGSAFAEQFAQAYLQTYGTSNQENSSATLLNYFYSGSGVNAKDGFGSQSNGGNSGGQNVTIKGNINQKILIQPRVYQSVVAGPTSATFYVNALVSNYKGSDMSSGAYAGKWISLAINVLYDTKHDALSINPDSPSIVPTMNIQSGIDATREQPLVGTGETVSDDTTKAMQPTITGFLTAYSDVTQSQHSLINQFVNSDADNSVYEGFGGYYKYDASNSSNNTTAYKTDKSNVYKAVVVSIWKSNTSGSQASVSYPSKYVMTLEKVNGKFFVTKINPLTYTPKSSN